jgi:methionine-rich copper-binding protein CopC
MRFFVILLGLLATISVAQAHAMLERAMPPVGSTTADAPSEVVLVFTQDIEPAFSRIEVRDAKGNRVSASKAQTGASKRELRVAIRPSGTGRYSVNWNVLSVDTHKSEGRFSFQVGP